MSSQSRAPSTPDVVPPSPSSSETTREDGYFAPQTRSKTISRRAGGSGAKAVDVDVDPELSRARSRSRSPQLQRKVTGLTSGLVLPGDAQAGGLNTGTSGTIRTGTAQPKTPSNGAPIGISKAPNGFLSPESAVPEGKGSSYWRNLSRSPSPLGLIPIHREWRAFVHKHEVPRKVLHVSIGFVTLWLYYQGVQTSQIHPVLLSLLIPILSADLIRFQWPAFNRLYIRILGPFMRESEAHDRFNGVISYLAGLWATMYFCSKDVAVMSVLLLSWCDTAASTFGRLYGKYTPRIRKGKSLAGSLAAFVVGVASAVLFWGFIAGTTSPELHEGFTFQGTLRLPVKVRGALGLSKMQATISGSKALAVLSVMCGLVASVSEAIDIFGLDDNLTIPILSGLKLEVLLRALAE